MTATWKKRFVYEHDVEQRFHRAMCMYEGRPVHTIYDSGFVVRILDPVDRRYDTIDVRKDDGLSLEAPPLGYLVVGSDLYYTERSPLRSWKAGFDYYSAVYYRTDGKVCNYSDVSYVNESPFLEFAQMILRTPKKYDKEKRTGTQVLSRSVAVHNHILFLVGTAIGVFRDTGFKLIPGLNDPVLIDRLKSFDLPIQEA